MERICFKSVCTQWVGKHLKEDWLIVSVSFKIMALKIFLPLLKSFIASVLKHKADLHIKVECICIMLSLVMSPFSHDILQM